MSEENGNRETAEAGQDSTGSGPPMPAPALFVALLSLVVAVAAAGGGGWLWWEKQALEQRLVQLEQTVVSPRQLERRHEDVVQRLAALEADWRDAEAVLETLRPLAREGRSAWLRAEALWLLRVADHNLRLGGEPQRSMEALKLADERLRMLDEPELVGVREALAEDLAELEAMPRPDRDGMVLRLASLARQSAQWPLRRPEQPQARLSLPEEAPEVAVDEQQPTWQRLLKSLGEVARGLVVIRRHEEPLAPLLPPEQAYFTRLNAALQLDALRLAVLRGDAHLFSAQLTQARDWIETHFDPADESVAAALETLGAWQDVNIDPAPPEPVRALQRLQRLHAGEPAEPDNGNDGEADS